MYDNRDMNESRFCITNAKVIDNGVIIPASVFVEDGVIRYVDETSCFSNAGWEIFDAKGLYLSSGFIDIHVHGGGGSDFMDASYSAWSNAIDMHLKHGTTSIVPTTLASDIDTLIKALETFNDNKSKFNCRVLGIHVEGPYISQKHAGAQDMRFIRNPDRNEYEMILGICPDIIRWTIAPELPGAMEMGDYLLERNVLPSIGHSDATSDVVYKAMFHGYTHITHLYSAMSTIVRKNGFRHAGVIECAYMFDRLTSEVIADGCHLPPEILSMVFKFIGSDRVCLVTDAMRAAGENCKESILGDLRTGQSVIIENGVAKLKDRSAFAGSIATADRLVRTVTGGCGISLAEAVKMMTLTPAKILGREREIGSVKTGYKADLILFDRNIDIKFVMVGGKIKYKVV